MTEHIPTVVVGAGQAGLALSHCLTECRLPHAVLDRGTIAHSWRTQRWDSFTLLSPNWQTRLPGHHYRGADPQGFMTGRQVVAFFEEYARSFDAPVRCGVRVRRVTRSGHRWLVATTAGLLTADNVVIATGDLTHPRIPELSADLPPSVAQLHTSAYRNPAQLPAGAVLVVGAGPSGQQIAAELAGTGRRVHLAVGRHRCLPRRYRGHDTYWWMDRLGMLHRTLDSLAAPARRAPNAVLAGGTRDLDVRRLVAEGVVAHGRLLGLQGGAATFADDLRGRRVGDLVDRRDQHEPARRPGERRGEREGCALGVRDDGHGATERRGESTEVVAHGREGLARVRVGTAEPRPVDAEQPQAPAVEQLRPEVHAAA